MITLTLNVSDRQLSYQEIKIITSLISVGALEGVKGGKTIIHFDDEGKFRGIQYDYWPYKERKSFPQVVKS